MSRARASWIVALAALVVTAVLWLLLRRDLGEGAAAANADAPATSPSESPVGPSALDVARGPAETSDTASRETVAITAPALPVEAPRADLRLATKELELHGTLVLLDESGNELPPPDASFLLFKCQDGIGFGATVEVHAGKWSATIEDPSRLDALSVGGVLVGERVATVESPSGSLPVSGEQAIEIRARFPHATVLRVVDAATGIDLDGVELVRRGHLRNQAAKHPGRVIGELVIASHARSPVDLGALATVDEQRCGMMLSVGADGLAWESTYVDFLEGGEHVVSLVRGASLDVAVTGVDPTAQARLRLRRAGERGLAFSEVLVRDGPVSISGLVPGSYSVRAEVGEPYREIVLGGAEAELAIGRVERVELVLQPAPTAEAATAGGRIYLAKEWQLESLAVGLQLLGTRLAGFEDMIHVQARRRASDREGYDLFAWSQSHLQVGSYELGAYRPRFSTVIDLPKGGRNDFELVVPPPAELRVFVVDEDTGAEVITTGLSWIPVRPTPLNGYALESAKRDSASHSYVIRAPACAIELSLWADDYLPYGAVVDLATGVREHTIRLQRACGFTLSMKDGDTEVPFPEDWFGVVRAVSGNGKFAGDEARSGVQRFLVTEPGTYSIALPKLAGYLQPPPQTVEVFAGRYTEHVVALERERP